MSSLSPFLSFSAALKSCKKAAKYNAGDRKQETILIPEAERRWKDKRKAVGVTGGGERTPGL